MAQLMPLPLTVSCFSKIQIGFTFLVPAHLGSPGKGPLNVCVVIVERQEGDGDFSQISSEENELDDELPSNMVSVCLF